MMGPSLKFCIRGGVCYPTNANLAKRRFTGVKVGKENP